MKVVLNGPAYPPFSGLLYILLIVIMTTLSACAGSVSGTSQASPAMKTLKTSILYRERMMLPPGSIVSVTIEDVSRIDTKAETLSKVEIEATGAPPYQVAINYAPADIKEQMSYNLRAQIHNGGQLLFTSTDKLDPFKTQGTDEVTIILQRVTGSKKPTKQAVTLTNTHWKLVMLGGMNVELGAEGKELSMVLESGQSRVRGFSGCNNFSGSFTQEDNKLRFDQLISTQMACMEGMKQEFAFLQALSTTDHFKINGQELLIYTNSGEFVARFIAL